MHNAQIEYAKEIEVEIQHEEKKVISDTNEIQDIVEKQVNQIWHHEEEQKEEEENVDKSAIVEGVSKNISDTEIVESIVKDQLKEIMSEGDLRKDIQKSRNLAKLL